MPQSSTPHSSSQAPSAKPSAQPSAPLGCDASRRSSAHPQVYANGAWRDVRPVHEYSGGMGYATFWWTLDASGHVALESVGYSDFTFRRMLHEGRARFQPDAERGAWADEESIRRLDRPSKPTAIRRVPEAATTREALRRLLHVRGSQWEQHTGEDWDARRPELIDDLLGYACSSNDLDRDALSALVDRLTVELEEAGFDLASADAEYEQRREARERAFETRNAEVA